MSNPQTPPASSPSATRVQSNASNAPPPRPAQDATSGSGGSVLPVEARSVHSLHADYSPRKSKPGTRNTAEANTNDVLLQSHVPTKNKWYDLTLGGYAYTQGGNAMDVVNAYMAPRGPEAQVAEEAAVEVILSKTESVLKKARMQADQPSKTSTSGRKRRQENKITPVLIETLETITKRIGALDAGDHQTGPDVLVGLPGRPDIKLGGNWALGEVLELKDVTNIINDKTKTVVDSIEARDALTQISKSARSLLMYSHRTHAWIIAVFRRRYARIFCYDRTGFVVSKQFDWIGEPTVLATFHYRLFHPPGHPGRIDGDDFTIERLADCDPDSRRRKRLFAALQDHAHYKEMFPTLKEATESTLAIRASRRDENGVEREVTCLTFGDHLWQSDGLFSRATTVYRVVVEEDLVQRVAGEEVQVYALKDAWRESCRQPEADFYDTIARYCRDNDIDMDAMNIAQCHGSVDVGTLSGGQKGVHTTRFLRPQSNQNRDDHLRVHVRTLLTPVGIQLRKFTSIQTFIGALGNAMDHHYIAFKAGVLHRDVSEGNVLLVEAPPKGELPKGFLMDWDYAEFTEAGAQSFNAWIAQHAIDREPVKTDTDAVDKKLKDVTGTRPFMSIQILEAAAKTRVANLLPQEAKIRHGPHHDLESCYWLLVWMVLRYTEHADPDEERAAGLLFDVPRPARSKRGYFAEASPVDPTTSPLLFKLMEDLKTRVQEQNNGGRLLQHDEVVALFDTAFKATTWDENDNSAAKKFVPPAPHSSYDLGPVAGELEEHAGQASKSNRDVEMPDQEDGERNDDEDEDEELPEPKKSTAGSGKRQRQEADEPEPNAGSGSKKRRTTAPRAANTSDGSTRTSQRSSRPRDGKGRFTASK
ncbi:hypothetical protein HMN09_01264800 [Mycena chlorophos]|uniref:Fungal-type protein kinase domain-containing protein n=1 Tax=Mycena chlorophos TaxID=658473 RepID=A0A8H6S5K7_MYCCL|nr:hypothetical protein HMN09_01264800 [Mycena chlorophos]